MVSPFVRLRTVFCTRADSYYTGFIRGNQRLSEKSNTLLNSDEPCVIAHSLLKLSTGFTKAVFADWSETVSKVMPMASKPARANTHP